MPEGDLSESFIYIADDVAANRSLLAAVLSQGGLSNVHAFDGGRSLLAAIDEREPDLILLDLRMPGMDGFEVLRALEQRRSSAGYLPVIVLTAESAQIARSTALAAGANDYVTKPFDGGEVLLRARNLLQTRALHRALQARNTELVGEVDTARNDLSSREREWADVSTSLSQLETRASAEETAQAICDELRKISGLTSVTVVAIDASGNAVPLAYDGIGDVRITPDRALPEDLTDYWARRVRPEAWIGAWEPAFGTPLRGGPVEQPTALAIIPLQTSKGVLGAVSATTARHDGIAYLTERLPILNSFGAMAGALLGPGILERQQRGVVRGELRRVLEDHDFSPVFQPIVELNGGNPVGFEALTRFSDGVRPDRRFADAAAVGLGIELETATLKAALLAARELPPDLWVSLNVSPAFLLDAPRLLRRSARGAGRSFSRSLSTLPSRTTLPSVRPWRPSGRIFGTRSTTPGRASRAFGTSSSSARTS